MGKNGRNQRDEQSYRGGIEMSDFNTDEWGELVGKKVKRYNGHVYKVISLARGPSVCVEDEDGNRIDFSVGSPCGVDWEIYEEEINIENNSFYETIEGEFVYIHEITHYIGYPKIIASIVTGNITTFMGDAKTNVIRKAYSESEFKLIVRKRC